MKDSEEEAGACVKWQIFRSCGSFGDQVFISVLLISSWSGFLKGLLIRTSHLLFLLYEFPFLFFSFYFSPCHGHTAIQIFFQRGIGSSLKNHLEKNPDFWIWTWTRSRTYELKKLFAINLVLYKDKKGLKII